MCHGLLGEQLDMTSFVSAGWILALNPFALGADHSIALNLRF